MTYRRAKPLRFCFLGLLLCEVGQFLRWKADAFHPRLLSRTPPVVTRRLASDRADLKRHTDTHSPSARNRSHVTRASRQPVRRVEKSARGNVKSYVNKPTLGLNKRLNDLSKEGSKVSAVKAQQMLDEAIETFMNALHRGDVVSAEDADSLVVPNTVSATAVLNAWSRSPLPYAAEQAQKLLERMIKLAEEDGYTEIRPNVFSFYAVLNAWKRSSDPRAGQRAEENLRRLQRMYQATSDPDLRPDANAYTTVINAIARSKNPGCADRAARLLYEMEDLYVQGETDFRPVAACFGSIINAYANEQDLSSVDKAIHMMQHMESLYQLGYESARPNTFVYNACMNVFAQTAGLTSVQESSATGAEDTDGSAGLSGNSNSPSDDTSETGNEIGEEAGPSRVALDSAECNAEKARQILSWMETQYHEDDNEHVKPDVISYSTCINAYAKTDGLISAGPMASSIIERMTHFYLLSGDTEWRMNSVIVNSALAAWQTTVQAAKSKEDHSDEHRVLFDQASIQCRSLLTQLGLLHRAGTRMCKPTKGVLDTATSLLESIGDDTGVAFVSRLREASTTF